MIVRFYSLKYIHFVTCSCPNRGFNDFHCLWSMLNYFVVPKIVSMCCSPKTIENKTKTIFNDMEIQKMQMMISLKLVQNKMFILVPLLTLFVCYMFAYMLL